MGYCRYCKQEVKLIGKDKSHCEICHKYACNSVPKKISSDQKLFLMALEKNQIISKTLTLDDWLKYRHIEETGELPKIKTKF